MPPRKWGGGYSSSWVRPTTRLAIYLRDGLGCVYCQVDWSRSGGLTLDHVVPRSLHGRNDVGNLVTSCRNCNNIRRQLRGMPLFSEDEWAALERVLRRRGTRENVEAHLALPLDTFRVQARVLHANPPKWLQELRALSTTAPGDERRVAEERGTVPLELLAFTGEGEFPF